jgi:hypothetical protein
MQREELLTINSQSPFSSRGPSEDVRTAPVGVLQPRLQ